MRYKKSITIMLVSLFVIASISTQASARLFQRETPDTELIEDDGTLYKASVKADLDVGDVYLIKTFGPSEVDDEKTIYYPINLEKDFPQFMEKVPVDVHFKGRIFYTTIIGIFMAISQGLLKILRICKAYGAIPIILENMQELEPDINLPPIADFEVDPESKLVVGEPVQFLDKSTDPDGDEIVIYRWNFGDEEGSTSTLQNPTHVYNKAATYTVSLIVKDARGGLSKACEKQITIEDSEPDPEIYYDLIISVEGADNGCGKTDPAPGTYEHLEGKEVQIIAYVLVNCVECCKFSHWTVNGVIIEGSEPELFLTMDSDKSVVAHFITKEPEELLPKVDFYWDPVYPVAGDTVTFTDLSFDPDGGDIVERVWIFPDGSEVIGVENPTYVFETPGTYLVGLKVVDDEGQPGKLVKTVFVGPSQIDPVDPNLCGIVVELGEPVDTTDKPVPIPIIPVKEAHVELIGDTTYSTDTDDMGRFELEAEPGIYTITITHDEYETHTSEVEVPEEGKIFSIFPMEPK